MFRFGEQRNNVCSVNEPSLFAKVFSSRRKFTPDVAKRTPFTFSAASFAASSKETLSAIAIENGSVLIGERHVPFCAVPYAASTIGFVNAARFALACATAFRATAVTASVVRSAVAAKHHAPFTSVR